MGQFKVGDKVRYKGTNPAIKGKTGKVEAVKTIDGLDWVTIKDGGDNIPCPAFQLGGRQREIQSG